MQWEMEGFRSGREIVGDRSLCYGRSSVSTAPTAKRRARACPSPGWLVLEKIVDIQREFMIHFNAITHGSRLHNVARINREGEAMEGRQ